LKFQNLMSASNASVTDRSEDEFDRKLSRCLSNAVVKISGGIGLGILFSLFIFNKRTWPVVMGTGIGIGMSYSDCNSDFKRTAVNNSISLPSQIQNSNTNSTSSSEAA
ncbi:Mitochondrial inner membrane organizing system protein 1, partial [Trichinella britovi]